MRIISKYKDYYDFAISYGIDSTLIFDRSMSFFEEHPFDKPRIEEYRDSVGNKVTLQPFVVVVAGKIYRGKYLYGSDNIFFYNLNQQKEYFDKHNIGKNYFWYSLKYEFFNGDQISTKQLSWVKENNVIIGSTGSYLTKETASNLYINGNNYGNNFISNHSSLKNLKFQQAIDGLDLFNEISMWISNLNQKEIITLNNEEKLVKAGFDKKISFRNPIK